MLSLGGMEILVILVVALLVLGPEKLPNFMRTIGKAVGELRRVSTEFQRTVHTEIARGEEMLSKTIAVPEAKTPMRERTPAASESPAANTTRKRSLPRAPKAAIARSVRRARAHNDTDAGRA